MGKNRVFRFKRFAVDDSGSAMKVGTDGVLLGAWCAVDGVRRESGDGVLRVLDVGTGCGVIALMVAQRAPQAVIEGVDIDPSAAAQAAANFAASPWSDRLTARCADVNDLAMDVPLDLIVCNPPFYDGGIMPPDAQREQARHTTSLTLTQLLTCALRWLAPAGTLALITPCDAAQVIVEFCAYNALNVRRRTMVVPVEGHEPKRILWELTPERCAMESDTLVMTAGDGAFTPQYSALVGEFYLRV